jgi:putative molybdopterin biosynthesis protein
LAELIVIGSHCVGLDYLLTILQQRGIRSKLLSVGSSAGLLAAKRGECDLAGIHLLDPVTGTYNRPYLDDSVTLVDGYGRSQGVVFRPDDGRFLGMSVDEIVATSLNDPSIAMVSRNQGSGTRVLIDRLLGDEKPNGSGMQPSNHNAVAAAIVQRRADWGMTIEAIARSAKLAFIPFQDEQFDFAIPIARLQRPDVQAFIKLLSDEEIRQELRRLGLIVSG